MSDCVYKRPGLGVVVDDRQPSLSGEGVCVCVPHPNLHTQGKGLYFSMAHIMSAASKYRRDSIISGLGVKPKSPG